MRAINFLFGFLIGALIGAATVLLSTPKSGQALKSDLRARIDDALTEGRRAAAARRAELEARLASLTAS